MFKHVIAILIINMFFSALSYSQVSGSDTRTSSVQKNFREITVRDKERLDLFLAEFQTMRAKHERTIKKYMDSTDLAKSPGTTGTGLVETADGTTYSLELNLRIPYEASRIIYNFYDNRSNESIKLIHAVSNDNVSQVVWRSKLFGPEMSGAMVIYKGKTIYGFSEFDKYNNFAGLNFSTDANGKIDFAGVRKEPSSVLVKRANKYEDYSPLLEHLEN